MYVYIVWDQTDERSDPFVGVYSDECYAQNKVDKLRSSRVGYSPKQVYYTIEELINWEE